MSNPLEGIIPAAIGPYVAVLTRPDGSPVVVSGDTAPEACEKLIEAMLVVEASDDAVRS